MKRKMIACIFCGKMADIIKKGDLKFVWCSSCKSETELGTYQELFDQWVDDKRKAFAKEIMSQDGGT